MVTTRSAGSTRSGRSLTRRASATATRRRPTSRNVSGRSGWPTRRSPRPNAVRFAIAVAVVDVRGDPIQLDTMDGAPSAAPFVAEALAAGAATFQAPSAEIDPVLTAVLPYRVLTVPGGLPVWAGERVVGRPRHRRRGYRGV